MSIFEANGLNYLSATEKFVEAEALANQLADQNDRLVVANEDIDDEEFRAIARAGLAQEQADTLEALKKQSDETPYQELAIAHMSVSGEIAQLKSGIMARLRVIDQETHHLYELANLTAKVAPYAAADARRLADIRAGALVDPELESLREQLVAKEQELENLDRLYEKISAWPVPQTERNIPISTLEEVEEVIDEIPVDPTPFDREEEERMREYAERHIDEPALSRWAAFYLKEFENEVMTVDDLISFIYKEDVIERAGRDSMRSRITTTLGPKVKGPRIQAMLAEEGLVLQYGWRKVKIYDKATGRELRSSPRTRIYRAVPYETFSETHLESETTHTDLSATQDQAEVISWRSTPELARLIGENLIRATQEHDISVAAEIAKSERAPEETVPATVQEGRILRIEKVPGWVPNFVEQVNHAIILLAEQGLISPEPLTQDIIRIKSMSAKMGTNEAISRLERAGLISRSQAKEKVFEARAIVLMHLFNSNREILTASSRNKQKAIEEIDRSLGKFFRSQEA